MASRRWGNGEREARERTLPVFSKESARHGLHPLMASSATAESQAGQPASSCSPRAVLANLGPGTLHDERERLYRRADRSARATGCSAFPAASSAATVAGGSGTGHGGWAVHAAMGLHRWSLMGERRLRRLVDAGRGWEAVDAAHGEIFTGAGSWGKSRGGVEWCEHEEKERGIAVEQMRRLRLVVGSGRVWTQGTGGAAKLPLRYLPSCERTKSLVFILLYML